MENNEKRVKMLHIVDNYSNNSKYEEMRNVSDFETAKKWSFDIIERDKQRDDVSATWSYDETDECGMSWIYRGTDYERRISVYFV